MFQQKDLIAEVPRLRRYAQALLGDAGLADDLVQDTLERALQKASLWQGGNLCAWLLTLMHNIFLNQWKRNRKIEYRASEDLPETPVAEAQHHGLELRDLKNALGQLSDEHRAVLLLIGLEELSYEEAAEVIGVPIGTVMSRLARARDRLRSLLAMDGRVQKFRIVK